MRQLQQQRQQTRRRRIRTAAVGAAFTFGLLVAQAATFPPLDEARWIWSGETSDAHCDLRTLDAAPTNASVLITADNGCELHVNGSHVGWYSDHPALYACHSSPIHARIIEALGEIGERRAQPALLAAVRNLDNATDVRHAAATALGKLAGPSDLAVLKKLAADYPEVSVRKALQVACARLGDTDQPEAKLARRNGGE
jgi:hypothetical protein